MDSDMPNLLCLSLVRAVQELSEQNEAQNIVIASMNARFEQQQRLIENLQHQIDELRNPNILRPFSIDTFEESAFGTMQSKTASPVLHQNVPNPFSQSTQIRYYLPETVSTASLRIFDMNGRQLMQIPLTERGEGMEVIQNSQFAPGIYLYALIADGQKIDVKRMILTE